MFVSVIGGSNCSGEDEDMAEAVGFELGRRGITVICGGLTGVMTAVCRGAKSAGGTTVGIIPGSRREDANQYVDITIVTTMGEARNIIVANSGQAVIAIGGEYGTLSEIAYALRSKIPVIGINTWSLAKCGQANNSIIMAESPQDAVEKAVAAIQGRGGRR